MVNSDEVWCETCGRDIEPEDLIDFDGDCPSCRQWWIDNPPE